MTFHFHLLYTAVCVVQNGERSPVAYYPGIEINMMTYNNENKIA